MEPVGEGAGAGVIDPRRALRDANKQYGVRSNE